MGDMDEKLVIAVDIGGTYTSYSFGRHGDDHQTVVVHPTKALVSSDGEIRAFGEEAEDVYVNLTEAQRKEYFYFGAFRNYLDQKNFKGLQRSTEIADINGRKIGLLYLIKATIEHLRGDMFDKVSATGTSLAHATWLFVVPVSWNQKPKQLIRDATHLAGLDTDAVEFALESEANALYCQKHFSVPQQRSKFLVCNIEDCEMKAWIYATKQDGTLEETSDEFDIDTDVISIESCIRVFMDKLVRKPVLEKIKQQSKPVYDEYNSQMDHITVLDGHDGVCLQLSGQLKEFYKKETNSDFDSRASTFSKDRIEIFSKYIIIKPSLLSEMCESYLRTVVYWLMGILRHKSASGIERIYVTGRNASFLFVQHRIRKEIDRNLIWVPNPENSKLLGALSYGHKEFQIKKRKMRFSYGILNNPVFVPGGHDASHAKYDEDGVKRCSNVFLALVEKGDLVGVSECVQRTFRSQQSQTTSEIIDIYQSVNQSTKYVTDEGCDFLGRVKVHLLDKSVVSNKDFTVKMCFGGSELQMVAVDQVTNVVYNRVFHCI